MPILDIQKQYAEVGRIRLGKVENNRPVKLNRFRFTSHSEDVINAIAAAYGGMPNRWEDEWEVEVESDTINVLIPPGDVFSQWMEHWGKKSCIRRCDRQTCTFTDKQGNQSKIPCWCKEQKAEGELNDKEACKPRTRFSVILPDIPGLGVWRVESGSWQAAKKLLGQFEMLKHALSRGIPVHATLIAEEIDVKVDGKTQKAYIPTLHPHLSVEDLFASQAGLPAPDTPALGPGEPIDAEPVEEEPVDAETSQPSDPTGTNEDGKLLRRYWAIHRSLEWPMHAGVWKDKIHAVWAKVLGREKVNTWHELSIAEKQRLCDWIADVEDGNKTPPKAFTEYAEQARAKVTAAAPVHDPADPFSNKLEDSDYDPFAD